MKLTRQDYFDEFHRRLNQHRPTYYDFWKAKFRWPILGRIEDAWYAVKRLRLRLQGRCTQCMMPLRGSKGKPPYHKMDCSAR